MMKRVWASQACAKIRILPYDYNSLKMSNPIIIKEVKGKKALKGFIRFPDMLYKDNPYYVPALHRGQLATLSKDKNPAFEVCDARYWMAYKNGQPAGRIAGIVNHRYNEDRGRKYMRFGWLDFIEDKKVLAALLGKVEQWGRELGLQSIHGPLGFSSFDASGVLVEGFEEMPTSFGRYNYPYYDAMIREAGYIKDIDWVEYTIEVPPIMPDKIAQFASLVSKRYGVRNAVLGKSDDLELYGRQVFGLINEVYSDLYAYSRLTDKQIEGLMKEFLGMVHPDYVSVILNEQDELVAFGLVMPSLSRALQKARGCLYPFGFWHVLKALKHNDTVDMLLIGVRPDYQGKGIHALIFEKIVGTFYKRGIRRVETTRELENNNKVQQLWVGYEPRQHKRARCYIREL